VRDRIEDLDSRTVSKLLSDNTGIMQLRYERLDVLREASRSGYREYRQGSRQSGVTFLAAFMQGISGTGH
jgi:hypothetical protein